MKPPSFKCRKLIGLVLSGALLATQSLFAYQPEKNFWSERRRAAQRGSSTLLASLPQTVQGPTSLAAQFPSPEIIRSSLTPSVVRSVPKTFLTGHADLLAALSPAHGSVRKVSLGKNGGSRGPVVIHIQDVHMNAEAQKNIRETVAALLKSEKVGLVALEGSTEDIVLQPFVDFPNRKAVELTADYLLRENKISGPIHAAMTAQGKLPCIMGIDDPVHYAANVQAYKDSAPRLDDARRVVKARQAEINEQKKTVFSPALLAFDGTVTDYRNGKASLGNYVEVLVSGARASRPKSAGETPALLKAQTVPKLKTKGIGVIETFLQALKTERTLDFKRVEAERSRLIEKLTNTLNPQEINELMAQSLAYRTGELRYGDFYAQLKESCRKKGIRLSDSPAMDEYVRYVLLCDGIDAEELLNEIARMEKAAYNTLAKTPEEKALAAQSRQMWLTTKLVDFALTPPEWLEYKSANGYNTDLASFESFYQEAEARDTAMAQNLLTALDHPSKTATFTPPVAVLVTGGFHAEGMAKQLTEQGATVISYVPKIEKVDTAQGSAYLSVFTQAKTPLEKLFQGEKLFLAQDPWTISDRRQASAGIIGVEEVLASGPRSRVIEELESAQLVPSEVFEAVDTTSNTADVSWNGAPVAQVTLNSGVMSMSEDNSLLTGKSIFRKVVELGDPLRAFKQLSEFNLSVEGFSRLFAGYVVNHFGNEVIDNRLGIPFAKQNGEEGVDKIDLFQRLEPHLSNNGLDYLRQLLDARARGDKAHLLSLQADYPTKARPRLELFTPVDEAMWIQWSRSGDRIAAIRLSEGCSRGCEHCYFNPSKRVVVLPYFRLMQILNRMKTSNKPDGQFASVITLHEDNEIFDYYDPVFEADVADVVLGLRREFPNQSIGITTRGWYQGDRVAPQAAKKLANLRRQDPSAINLIYSLDLFDRMGNVTRMFARILVNLDLLSGGSGSIESETIFLQPTHDQGSELGVRRLISWTRYLATANLDLIAPNMGTSPISISKGRGKKLQSSSGHPVDSCIWGLHIFPSGRAARKTESKETYEYLVQPRLFEIIPIPQWSESVSLWTGGLDVTDLIPKKIPSREDPLKDIFPRRSGPSTESGKKGTGWTGVGVAWGWGMALGTWKKMRGRLEQGKSIRSFVRDYVSHEAGRRAAWAEDFVNAMVSFFVGLVAGQKLDVLSWLSTGTLSPPLGIILAVVLVIVVWFLLLISSHAFFRKALERLLGEKPSVAKASRLFLYYLVPLTITAFLGYGLAAHDLSPFLSFIIPISMFKFIGLAHDRINSEKENRGGMRKVASLSVIVGVVLLASFNLFARSNSLPPAIPVSAEKVAPWKEKAISDLQSKFGHEVASAILEEQVRITKKFFPEVKDEVLEKMASLVRPNKNAEGWGSSTKILIPEVWVLGSVEGVRIFVAHETAHLLFRPYSKGSNPPLDSDFKAYRHQIHSVIYAMGFLRGMELGLEGKYGMYRSGVLGWGSIINHSANHHFHVGYDLAKEAWELEQGTPGKGWEFLRGKLDKKSELERRDLVGFLTLPALVYFVYPLIGLAFFLLYMKDRNGDGSATSRWAVKFAEWIGSKVDPVKGREIFGVFYKRFAASIEWSVSANIAFWGFMGSLAFLGAPLGWAVAPAVGAVYGILFVASHFIPESMAPVTKVKVGVVQALTMGVIYGVLIGTTPFLLGTVPLLGIPEFGVQAGGLLWALAGLLHHSFDKKNLREEGKEAAWKMIEQLSHVQGAFEAVMPGVQKEHTEQIVGKGSSTPDFMTETLLLLKTDKNFRIGFEGAVQTAIAQEKLSGTSFNLLSAMVMAATGQPMAYVHVLGKSPDQEFETLYRLTERPEGKTSSGFAVALVVSQSQRTDFETIIDVLEARGVTVFSVDTKGQGWTQEALVRLDREMSPFLANADGIVATVGEKVGINLTAVAALSPDSKLRTALMNALTLGEVVETFLRVLRQLASNA